MVSTSATQFHHLHHLYEIYTPPLHCLYSPPPPPPHNLHTVRTLPLYRTHHFTSSIQNPTLHQLYTQPTTTQPLYTAAIKSQKPGSWGNWPDVAADQGLPNVPQREIASAPLIHTTGK